MQPRDGLRLGGRGSSDAADVPKDGRLRPLHGARRVDDGRSPSLAPDPSSRDRPRAVSRAPGCAHHAAPPAHTIVTARAARWHGDDGHDHRARPGCSPGRRSAGACRASVRGRALRPRQGGARTGTEERPRRMAAVGRAATTGRAPAGAGRGPGAGARAHPPWSDARVAVRVLPRRGRADGRAISRRRRTPASPSSCAATRTCRTSAASRRPIASSCSTSTTSTRRRAVPGSGTSSGSRRASRSRAASSA